MDPDQEQEMLRKLREKLGMPEKRDERSELERLFGKRDESPETKLRAELTKDRPGKGFQTVINIPRLAFDGRGLGIIADLPAFVDGPVPGDTVKVEITDTDGSSYQCRLLETVSRSSDRVRPRCDVFGQCAGCHLQSLSYPAQLRVKERLVADICRTALHQREAEVQSLVPSPEAFGYLTRISLDIPGGRPAAVTLANRTRHGERVEIKSCPLCDQPVNHVITEVPALFDGMPVPKAGARLTLTGTGESTDLLLSVRWEGPLDVDKIFERAQHLALPVAGISHARSKRRQTVGATRLELDLAGEKHAIVHDRFFPNNKYLTRRLRDQMIRLASPTGRDRVLITGAAAAFAFPPLRRMADTVLITDGSAMADDPDIPPEVIVKAAPAAVFQHPKILALPRKEPTLVIHALEGGPDCAPFINALAQQQIEKVLIVSWDLPQFGRCLQVLIGGGYRPRVIQPIDIWPNTRRVMVLAFLTHPLAGPSILTEGWQDLR